MDHRVSRREEADRDIQGGRSVAMSASQNPTIRGAGGQQPARQHGTCRAGAAQHLPGTGPSGQPSTKSLDRVGCWRCPRPRSRAQRKSRRLRAQRQPASDACRPRCGPNDDLHDTGGTFRALRRLFASRACQRGRIGKRGGDRRDGCHGQRVGHQKGGPEAEAIPTTRTMEQARTTAPSAEGTRSMAWTLRRFLANRLARDRNVTVLRAFGL